MAKRPVERLGGFLQSLQTVPCRCSTRSSPSEIWVKVTCMCTADGERGVDKVFMRLSFVLTLDNETLIEIENGDSHNIKAALTQQQRPYFSLRPFSRKNMDLINFSENGKSMILLGDKKVALWPAELSLSNDIIRHKSTCVQ